MGPAYAPVQAIGGDRLGRGPGKGGVSLSKLPSGRWRAQIYDSSLARNVSVSRVLGGIGTFATKSEAKRAREQARVRLGDVCMDGGTLRGFWERWTTDPLFARPKESTNIHNRERTRAFVERYGTRRMDAIDDTVVAEWLAGGKRNGTIPALRAMFNDAASAKGGRLVRQNPFARLGISRGPGVGSAKYTVCRGLCSMGQRVRLHSMPFLVYFAVWLVHSKDYLTSPRSSGVFAHASRRGKPA